MGLLQILPKQTINIFMLLCLLIHSYQKYLLRIHPERKENYLLAFNVANINISLTLTVNSGTLLISTIY